MATSISQPQDSIPAILENGEIEIKGQFTRGYNYTFLANVKYQGCDIPAVYKPGRGEQPLWDFPDNTLAGREVCAYLISEALGFGFVPYTILREGPLGPGMLQQYIDHDPDYHYFNFKPDEREKLRPVAFFDLLVNNADRKGGHILVQKDTRKLYLIDHGLCFHTEDKLRTVVWDFSGESFPPELVSILNNLRENLRKDGSLATAIGKYLNREEISALLRRAEVLLAERKFPYPPDDRRAFPYPPL